MSAAEQAAIRATAKSTAIDMALRGIDQAGGMLPALLDALASVGMLDAEVLAAEQQLVALPALLARSRRRLEEDSGVAQGDSERAWAIAESEVAA